MKGRRPAHKSTVCAGAAAKTGIGPARCGASPPELSARGFVARLDAIRRQPGGTATQRGNDAESEDRDLRGNARAITVSVPVWAVTGATSLLPKVAGRRLDVLVELSRIVEMLKNPEAVGKLVEIEDHEAGDRIVVSIAGDDPR